MSYHGYLASDSPISSNLAKIRVAEEQLHAICFRLFAEYNPPYDLEEVGIFLEELPSLVERITSYSIQAITEIEKVIEEKKGIINGKDE